MTVKLFEQSSLLMGCFDAPERTLEVVARVQEKLLKLIPIDPRGRIMFDYEHEDQRDELELLEDEEKEGDDKRSEHGVDLREPADIIEEYMQTLMLLAERQPAVAPKVLTLTPTPTLALTLALAFALALTLALASPRQLPAPAKAACALLQE